MDKKQLKIYTAITPVTNYSLFYEDIKNLKFKKTDKWKKYHSCCDWFYKNLRTGEEVMFCGLEDLTNIMMYRQQTGKIKVPASVLTGEKGRKAFEKGKIIVTE